MNLYTLKIQNASGELYELTHNPDQYLIEKITGLMTVRNTVNLSTAGTTAGGKFNSSHLESRNIVIYLVLCGDIEANRQLLYRIFPHDSEVTVFFKNANRDVKIGARVELVDPDPFSTCERAQVSLICPDPYWKSMYKLTAETSAQGGHPTCSLVNSGDIDIGFHAVMHISTEDPPPVTLAKSADASLASIYPYARHLFLQPLDGGEPVAYSTTLNKVSELFVDGQDLTAHIAGIDKLTKKSELLGEGTDYVHILLDADCITSTAYSINYVILSDSTGRSVETVQYSYDISSHFSDNPSIPAANANIGFERHFVDTTVDYYDVFMRTSASSAWVKMDKTDYTIDASGDSYTWAQFGYSLSALGYTEGKLVVYHDSTGADISGTLQVSERYFGVKDGTEWYFHCYDSLPAAYDNAKNVPYIGGSRIENSTLSEVYIFPDGGGDVQTYSQISGYTASPLTFSYVYSLSGADIRAYTDEQIEAGLAGTAFIHRITLRNTTTGEQLLFDSTRFQIGDVVDISTIPRRLQAKITERSGEAADISLLYDAYQNGTFFKLRKGQNVLEITADAHEEYLSAEVDARQLYGGV